MSQVGLDRGLAEDQLGGDLAVAASGHQQVQYLYLAGGQRLAGLRDEEGNPCRHRPQDGQQARDKGCVDVVRQGQTQERHDGRPFFEDEAGSILFLTMGQERRQVRQRGLGTVLLQIQPRQEEAGAGIDPEDRYLLFPFQRLAERPFGSLIPSLGELEQPFQKQVRVQGRQERPDFVQVQRAKVSVDVAQFFPTPLQGVDAPQGEETERHIQHVRFAGLGLPKHLFGAGDRLGIFASCDVDKGQTDQRIQPRERIAAQALFERQGILSGMGGLIQVAAPQVDESAQFLHGQPQGPGAETLCVGDLLGLAVERLDFGQYAGQCDQVRLEVKRQGQQ